MTLEVCNTMANLGNCDIEFNFQDMVPDSETEMATKHLEEMNNSLFPGNNLLDDTMAKNTEDCFTILQPLDTNQSEINFFPTDVQNCIEVESTSLANMPENQIVEIQFQDENGFVKTKYLVNNELVEDANLNSDLLSLEDSVNEEIIQYEIFNNEVATSTVHLQTIDDQIDSPKSPDVSLSLNPLNTLNVSVLSPQTESDEQSETDLTSLNWLHNITNIMSVPNLPTPPVSPPPKPKKKVNGQEDLTININFYKKNGDKKPPFSYATLICMAMGKNGNKMTLSAIYHWIKENFLYYRKAHPSWQVFFLV